MTPSRSIREDCSGLSTFMPPPVPHSPSPTAVAPAAQRNCAANAREGAAEPVIGLSGQQVRSGVLKKASPPFFMKIRAP